MKSSIRFVSSYPPRQCGIGTFSRDLITSLLPFTAEIGDRRVTAIDKGRLRYFDPVDSTIEQDNPRSWRHAGHGIVRRAIESSDIGPTIVFLEHEFGLDGRDGKGNNYVNLAKILNTESDISEDEVSLITLGHLHTVLKNPTDYQKATLQNLAKYTDRLVVPARAAIEILEETYGISRDKMVHIDHGIRMHDVFDYERPRMKAKLNIDRDIFLVSTPGLITENKGIPYGVGGFAEFIKTCSKEEREKMLYLVVGQVHPIFASEGGDKFRRFNNDLEKALERVRYTKLDDLGALTDEIVKHNDVVIINQYLDDSVLLDVYAASDTILLPYIDQEQISSGILADTVGSGRVAVSTKFIYARELLAPEGYEDEGVLGINNSSARGILIDSEKKAIEQIPIALAYLFQDKTGKKERFEMEKRARSRGRQMKWSNVAWDLINYIGGIWEEKIKKKE